MQIVTDGYLFQRPAHITFFELHQIRTDYHLRQIAASYGISLNSRHSVWNRKNTTFPARNLPQNISPPAILSISFPQIQDTVPCIVLRISILNLKIRKNQCCLPYFSQIIYWHYTFGYVACCMQGPAPDFNCTQPSRPISRIDWQSQNPASLHHETATNRRSKNIFGLNTPSPTVIIIHHSKIGLTLTVINHD